MKITKRNLIKLIKEQKILTESLKFNVNFDMSNDSDEYDSKKQKQHSLQAAKSFKIIQKPITVTKIFGNISEEELDITIDLSNGDYLLCHFYAYDAEAHGQEVTVNNNMQGDSNGETIDMEKFSGQTDSNIGDILLAYKEWAINNRN